MKGSVLEVLLDLKIHHSSGALQSDLIEGPFQLHSERRNLYIDALHNFIKVLH